MPDREREDRFPNREPPAAEAARLEIPAGRDEAATSVGEKGWERVAWGSVTERVRPPGIPRARSFLEWSGVWQMTLLLAFICLLAGGWLLGWTASRPDLADAVALVEAAKATGDVSAVSGQQLAQLLADLRAGHAEQVGDLFQLVVMTALVPLFTLLAGYVFGRGQQVRRQRSDEGDG